MTQYAQRDHLALGEHYLRHVSAMTGEGLHAKSDIAAELAWRDQEIERLRERLRAEEEIPYAYLLKKTAMVMPLFQEARDALTVITEQQRRIHGISPTLADRMDAAGTYSVDELWASLHGADSWASNPWVWVVEFRRVEG